MYTIDYYYYYYYYYYYHNVIIIISLSFSLSLYRLHSQKINVQENDLDWLASRISLA